MIRPIFHRMRGPRTCHPLWLCCLATDRFLIIIKTIQVRLPSHSRLWMSGNGTVYYFIGITKLLWMRENDTMYYFIGITKLFWMSGNDTVYYFIGITKLLWHGWYLPILIWIKYVTNSSQENKNKKKTVQENLNCKVKMDLECNILHSL